MNYFETISLDTTGFDSDCSHLFEHLVIKRIYREISKSGKMLFGFGDISGEAFSGGPVLLYLSLYNSQTHAHAHKVLESLKDDWFTSQEINEGMASLEAEEKQSINADISSVEKQLKRIAKIKAGKKSYKRPLNDDKPITFKKSNGIFKKLIVKYFIKSENLKNQEEAAKAYLFLDIVLAEAVRNSFHINSSFYQDEDQITQVSKGQLILKTTYTCGPSADGDYISEILSGLDTWLYTKAKSQIAEGLGNYMKNPLYIRSVMHQAAEKAGLVITSQDIRDLKDYKDHIVPFIGATFELKG